MTFTGSFKQNKDPGFPRRASGRARAGCDPYVSSPPLPPPPWLTTMWIQGEELLPELAKRGDGLREERRQNGTSSLSNSTRPWSLSRCGGCAHSQDKMLPPWAVLSEAPEGTPSAGARGYKDQTPEPQRLHWGL